MSETSLNRRDFLKVLGTAGASLVIGIYLGGCNEVETAPSEGSSDNQPTVTVALPADAFFAPNIYLTIDNTNQLTVTAFRSEMGQGVRTAIAMIIADELDVPWEQVKIEQAPADPAYGDQVTGGSASIQNHFAILVLVGGQPKGGPHGHMLGHNIFILSGPRFPAAQRSQILGTLFPIGTFHKAIFVEIAEGEVSG